MDTQDPRNTPEEITTQSGLASENATGAESPEITAGAANAEKPSTTSTAAESATDTLPTTDQLTQHAHAATGAPLATGAVIGGYRITEAMPASAHGPAYFAEPVESATPPEEELPGVRYIVRELTGGAANDQLAHIVAMGLKHPALLAPVALAREDGRLFLITQEITDAEGKLVPPMSEGERLRAVDALRAGIELADALAVMHHNSLAHLHISPEHVILYDGRIYLSGVEKATSAPADEEDSQPLFARDANFLARTMGLIGGVVDTTASGEETSAQRSLHEIAQRGEAGSFTRAEELAESFALTLQALAAAGAEMGADLRSVRLAVTAVAETSVGLVRVANQDAYGIAVFDIHDDAAADAPVGVFLVADGMGGEAHGEIASRLVARVVTSEMTRLFTMPVSLWPALLALDAATAVDSAPRISLAQALEAAVKEANRQTRVFGQRLQATTGSTVTALAISGARAAIAHLGDSRAYLLRDGNIMQLTEDHSLLAKMEAMRHPLLEDPSFLVPRSVLYRSVGQEDDVTPDLLEFVIAPGDRIVLCSDGLWDDLTSEVIGQAISEASTPRACASALVALANAAGGNDNSTAVVIFIEAEPVDDAFGRRSEVSVPVESASPNTTFSENQTPDKAAE